MIHSEGRRDVCENINDLIIIVMTEMQGMIPLSEWVSCEHKACDVSHAKAAAPMTDWQ